jgi:hypothetical protein
METTLSSKRKSHFTTRKSLGKNRNMVMGPIRTRNFNSAGQDKQQIYPADRPIRKPIARFKHFLEQDLEDKAKAISFYCFVWWLSASSVFCWSPSSICLNTKRIAVHNWKTRMDIGYDVSADIM